MWLQVVAAGRETDRWMQRAALLRIKQESADEDAAMYEGHATLLAAELQAVSGRAEAAQVGS